MNRFKDYLDRFRCRIESVARGTASAPFFSIETGLLVLSILYGGVMGIRARLYEKGVLPSKTLPCRVVSIGNLIAGGTGKTPMTILVARMIRDLGYRVVVVSRGYRGRMEGTGGIVSDGRTIFKGPEDAGDEPCLMARILTGIPVVVGKRRYDAGMMAVKRFQPDVIVLDDAFQHMRLKRDINLVLLDSQTPLGNRHILPRGLLREPVSALRRAHAIIFTRSNIAEPPSVLAGLPGRLPVFHTTHIPVIRHTVQPDGTFLTDVMDTSFLKGKKVVAFSGLANNHQFFDTLVRAGCILVRAISFVDHHRYDCRDLKRIAEIAVDKGADVLITTLKDFVKIDNRKRWPVDLVAVDVEIQLIDNTTRFLKFLSGTP